MKKKCKCKEGFSNVRFSHRERKIFTQEARRLFDDIHVTFYDVINNEVTIMFLRGMKYLSRI